MATVPAALEIALQHHQAGRLQEAEALYRQILQLQPNHPDALHLLGVIAHQVGQHDLAVRYISQAIVCNPQAPEFYNNIGEAYRALDKVEEAIAQYRLALKLRPMYAEAHNNLGTALKRQGRIAEAVTEYEQALSLRPAYAEAHNNLGNAFQEQDKLEEAAAQYRQALRFKQDYAGAYNNLGSALQEQGKLEEAITQYQQALGLEPNYAEAYNNLGSALRAQGKLEEAIAQYRQAVRHKSQYAEAYNNLGNVLTEQGKLEEAMVHYQQAIALKPALPDPYNSLGNLLRGQGQFEEAVKHYRQALAVKPSYAEAYKNLGALLHEQGKLEEAAAYYQQALKVKPKDALRILIASMVPIIAQSKEQVLEVRRNFQEKTNALLTQNLSLVDPAKEIVTVNFYLAYQGLNDRDIQQSVSRLYERACPSLKFTASHCRSLPSTARSTKIKIGFISCNFRNHTIGKLMRGIIAQLSRSLFSVIVFTVRHKPDYLSEAISRHADRTVILSMTLDAARQQIAHEQLDILLFTDIGMDPLVYFLAFSRLAPVQCVTWGHPVTTGIQAVDYFISSELLEPDDAAQHYSERLVRLNHLPTYYYKPETPVSQAHRSDFALDEGATLYVCPQSLFKFHPDFDELIAAILRNHNEGQLILLEGQYQHWTELLMQRFREAMPDVAHRIRFLPRQTYPDFLRLLSVADVMLDPLHWSGGNTTLEALAVGLPVVTLPSKFMRGRVTCACYKQMGVMDCVATTKEEYVKLAVRLGTDPSYRAKIKAKILAANNVLYENVEAVRDMERFFVEAVEAAQHAAKKQA